MATVFTDQTLPFTLVITKADGTPAVVDDTSIVYASSDETVLRVVGLAADNLSGSVDSVASGTARVSVTADADTGAGVVTITGVSEDVIVSVDPAALASAFSFTFGPPVPKTPPVTPPGP
jgi:hypothetical protein